jgi:radical SAM superfamily enzyme YgiQ (UPF0313 family)
METHDLKQPLVLLIAPMALEATLPKRYLLERRYPPLGLLNIAAVLESHGYGVCILDLWLMNDPMRCLSEQLLGIESSPLAVGITVCTASAHACAVAQRLIRQVFPETKIVLGGAHVSRCYEEALANPDTDVVVRGEGESTMVEVLESIRHPGYGLSRILGIAYRDPAGVVHCNPDRSPIHSLDQLPVPAYHHAENLADDTLFSLVSSRGCPGRCIFCAAQYLVGPKIRSHSAEWMFSVIYARYQRRPFTRLSILDDTFTAEARRVRAFCALIVRWGVRFNWIIRTRVDAVDAELVQTLAAAGCVHVHLGVESGDDEILRSIGKSITLAQVRKAIRLLLEHGIAVETSFILGHPADTLDTIEATLLWTMAVREFGGTAGIGICTPFPGTAIYDNAARLGIRIVDRDWRRYTLFTPIYEAPGFRLQDLYNARGLSQTRTFATLPPTLLTGNRHEKLRGELREWVEEMKQVRAASRPASPRCASENEFLA